MPVRFFERIDAIVAADPRAAAAAERLPTVIGTAEWPLAVRTYRSRANAAVLRALWRALVPQRPATNRETTMPHFPPIPAVSRHGRAMALWLAFAAAPVAGTAIASPAIEYGPEAEAQFLQRCEDSNGMNAADCRRLNERLQATLGYEAYLAHADGGPEAFARQVATRCIIANALRRDEPGCATRAAALTDR